MFDNHRLSEMDDGSIKIVWESIWRLKPEDRPDDDWIDAVYSQLSRRGLPA